MAEEARISEVLTVLTDSLSQLAAELEQCDKSKASDLNRSYR